MRSGGSCLNIEHDLAKEKCGFFQKKHFCCDDPLPLRNCHWVGGGDCADNTCTKTEVTIARSDIGGEGSMCRCEIDCPSVGFP